MPRAQQGPDGQADLLASAWMEIVFELKTCRKSKGENMISSEQLFLRLCHARGLSLPSGESAWDGIAAADNQLYLAGVPRHGGPQHREATKKGHGKAEPKQKAEAKKVESKKTKATRKDPKEANEAKREHAEVKAGRCSGRFFAECWCSNLPKSQVLPLRTHSCCEW